MDKTISILGCGWYGLELARALIAKNYKVKGSTTRNEKIALLEKEGVETYLIDLQENNSKNNPEFFNSKTLVICIPPKRSTGEQASYLQKIQQICNSAKNNTVENVLFISSTSIYGDCNAEVTETDIPIPGTDSGKVILEAEKLLQNQKFLNTTIVRFGGLIGPGRNPGKFFAGKTAIPNGKGPINLIHLKDCIGLSLEIIENKVFGYIFNACSPDHPEKQDFYTMATLNYGGTAPEFINELREWKIISSKYVPAILDYKYRVNNWGNWLKEDKI